MIGRLTGSLREAWRKRGWEPADHFRSRKDNGASNFELLFLRAGVMARAGDIEMAARLFADATTLEPTFAEAFEARGEILDVAGQRELASAAYEAARGARATLRPGAPDRHFALRQRGHFVAEINAYSTVLRSLKKNALPHLARGNAYLATGRPDKALADYDRALKLKPKLLDIMALRGEALSMLGHYQQAVQAFNACLAVRTGDAEALSGRAIAQMALGRIDEANADWRRQYELLAGRPSAQACVAMRLADYEEALAQVETALVKEPTDLYWRLYQMTARRRLGKVVGTAETLRVDDWPGPLLLLHASRVSSGEVLERADTAGRRAEALFQLGVLAHAQDRTSAERHWREVVESSAPSLIEHAAARNELARLGS